MKANTRIIINQGKYKMKAIAIDDEPLPLEIINSFCARIPYIQLESCYSKTDLAIKHLSEQKVDLVFLDVEMPSISGLELRKRLKENTLVIFTTAYSEYGLEGFNLQVSDFLLKPFSFDRFKQASEKALQQFSRQQKNNFEEDKSFLILKAAYGITKIQLSEIVYIESSGDLIKIVFKNNPEISLRHSLSALSKMLPTASFIRVHRSFILAKDQIKTLEGQSVILKSGLQIPIGSSYKNVLDTRD